MFLFWEVKLFPELVLSTRLVGREPRIAADGSSAAADDVSSSEGRHGNVCGDIFGF